MSDSSFRTIDAANLKDGDVLVLPFGKTAAVSKVKIGRTYVSFDTEYGKRRAQMNDELLIETTDADDHTNPTTALEVTRLIQVIVKVPRSDNDVLHGIQRDARAVARAYVAEAFGWHTAILELTKQGESESTYRITPV